MQPLLLGGTKRVATHPIQIIGVGDDEAVGAYFGVLTDTAASAIIGAIDGVQGGLEACTWLCASHRIKATPERVGGSGGGGGRDHRCP